MKKILDFVKPLVTDADELLSIGRTSYWIVFGIMVYFWLSHSDVSESMTMVFMTLMGYEVLKKGRDVVKSALGLNEDVEI